jgi:predicted RNA-binding Zn ribbon-like protein
MVRTTPETIKLWGGALCLDFANTVDWDADSRFVRPERTDVLVSGGWAVRWGQRMGVPGSGRISPAELDRLRELRVVVHRLFSTSKPAASDLRALRDTVAQAMRSAELESNDGPHFAPSWRRSDERRIRFAVAWDAVRLLEDPERLARVTRCPGRNCGWLFLNSSGRRRWCSMSACGSREKMRRAYARAHRTT